MTWEIAFTVVGCLWALVTLQCVKTSDEKELRAKIVHLESDMKTLKETARFLERKLDAKA